MSTIFGTQIRKVREEKHIPQRLVAAALEIDTATYCKIEKGDRRANRNQVTALANFLQVGSEEMIRLWLADKVYDIIAQEEEAMRILDLVAVNLPKNRHLSEEL